MWQLPWSVLTGALWRTLVAPGGIRVLGAMLTRRGALQIWRLWTLAWARSRRNRRSQEVRSAHLASRPVPTDLVGRCFNCLNTNHVAESCRNPSCYLRCKREGHRSRDCRYGHGPLRGGAGRSRAPPPPPPGAGRGRPTPQC